MTSVCTLLKIKKAQTTSYHPPANGSLERSQRTLEEYLRHYIGDEYLLNLLCLHIIQRYKQ